MTLLARWVAWVGRRPRTVLAVVVLLAAGGAALAFATLQPSTGADTLVGRSSQTWQQTQRYYDRFGDDAIYVLVREDLRKLLLTSDLETVLGLEGCLSGNRPSNATPPGGVGSPCGRLAALKPVQVVYGPGTFVNESVRQISDEFERRSQTNSEQARQAGAAARELALRRGYSQARAERFAKQARELVNAQYTRDVLQIALRYGLTGVPQLNDTSFVSKLVFADGSATGSGRPKARFAYLFPTADSALIQVRLRPGLSDGDRREAIRLIRQAVAMPQWRLSDGGYVVTGAPVVLDDLSGAISDSLVTLLIVALIVMAVVLALVFRVRPRLLPLGVALCASALTFGGLALAGLPLTMASIGVLPVLIGLAVDYAIQFQSRARESNPAHPDPLAAARSGGPTIVTAGVATAAGFAVLALSPVPMVREFGLMLVGGVLLALAVTLTAGAAVLTLVARRGARGGSLAAAVAGADELVAGNPLARGVRAGGRRAGEWIVGLSLRRGAVVVGVAIVLAIAGWALDTQAPVQSDVNRLVPQDLPALGDLRELQESTGVGGEIDVMVDAEDLTDPTVLQWMADYQQRVLREFGYRDGRRCGQAELCPAFSLPDLFAGQDTPTQAEARALLDAVPPYFSQAVVTPDRSAATLAFGIRLMALERQQQVIERMRAELDPPPGVSAHLVGLPVLAAQANDAVASPWRRFGLLLASLLAVAVVLLVALRSPRRALVPLAPIVLATGWSALVLAALRVELNPMSVTLGALVVAISTEFSVLLAERYGQERAGDHAPREALLRTYRTTGAAVVASGVTAIAGFAVLIVSDIQMLRDFGWVTVVDLAVSLIGVLIVLPAVLIAAERRAARRARARASQEAVGV
jgi:hydrophobe/amphiphile efflux-3 (HAE3) family protein